MRYAVPPPHIFFKIRAHEAYHRDAPIVALHDFFRCFLQELLRVETILLQRQSARAQDRLKTRNERKPNNLQPQYFDIRKAQGKVA